MSEDLRSRIGKLVIGPNFDPGRSVVDQAREVWQGPTKPAAEQLTEEEKGLLSAEELSSLSTDEARRLAFWRSSRKVARAREGTVEQPYGMEIVV